MEKRQKNHHVTTATAPFSHQTQPVIVGSKSVSSLMDPLSPKQPPIPASSTNLQAGGIRRTPKVLINNIASQQANNDGTAQDRSRKQNTRGGMLSVTPHGGGESRINESDSFVKSSGMIVNESSSSVFLDQMYLKCIERSKNLLHKNENLLRTLKSGKETSPAVAATSILSNQAQIEANQNQFNTALMSLSPLQQAQYQQQQMMMSPQQSNINNHYAMSSLNGSPSSPSSLVDIYTAQQQQVSQNDHYFNSVVAGNTMQPKRPTLTSPSTTSPVIGAVVAAAASPASSSIKLDYSKIALPYGNTTTSTASLRLSSNSLSGLKKATTTSNVVGGGGGTASSFTPRYEGEKVNGQRHGTGCQLYANGEVYQGEWKCDARDGYGILKDELGSDIYNGEWENDVFSGQGRLRNRFIQFPGSQTSLDYRNFDTLAHAWQFYNGEFANNLMHGHGTLVLYNHDKFMGKFQEGKVHGEATYYFANGETLNGIWNNQHLVKSHSIPRP